MSHRVVISGLGAVTPFGYGVDALWEGLLEGRCAIDQLQRFDASGFHCQFAAEAKDFQAKDHVPKNYRKAVKVMARDIELAVGAAKAAVEHAGVMTKALDAEATPTFEAARIGCHIGAGLIACEIPELASALSTSTDDTGGFSYEKWGNGAIDNLQPLWLLKYLPNMLACHVTILHDAQGPSNTITCAEASGLLSLGEATRVIQRGDADVCFAGSAESKVNPMGLIRMELADRLARVSAGSGIAPDAIVRVYDQKAAGNVIGEGAGILLLEAEESARKRRATVLCEMRGFGAGQSPLRGDASHRSIGLQFAIERALEDAGVKAGEIDAIVPHGAGVKSLDDEEIAAMRAVFGDRLGEIEMVTIVPAIGDTMAGGGGIAACVAAMCISRQMLPARIHKGTPQNGINAGAMKARDASLRHVLVCTNAFGGQNAAAVLSRASS